MVLLEHNSISPERKHICICVGPWTNSLHKVLESLVSFQTGSHYVVQASLELTALSPLPSECWSCMYAHPIKQILWCVVSKSVMIDVNLTELRTTREIIFNMLIKVRKHTHWVWYHFLVDILNCKCRKTSWEGAWVHGSLLSSCECSETSSLHWLSWQDPSKDQGVFTRRQ